MREDADTTVIVCRQDFAENRILYTYGRHAKELKNDGKTFLGPVFESMIEQAGIVDDAEEVGLMVHIRLRPKQNDDRWYQIDFVMSCRMNRWRTTRILMAVFRPKWFTSSP